MILTYLNYCTCTVQLTQPKPTHNLRPASTLSMDSSPTKGWRAPPSRPYPSTGKRAGWRSIQM